MTRLILTQSTSTDTGGKKKYVESTATMKQVPHLNFMQHLL